MRHLILFFGPKSDKKGRAVCQVVDVALSTFNV